MTRSIPPTPGRVLWFWVEGSSPSEDQPEAATVAYVHDERMVTLSVTDHEGRVRPEERVRLRQPDDVDATAWLPPFAEWMPYQIGQAAKAGT